MIAAARMVLFVGLLSFFFRVLAVEFERRISQRKLAWKPLAEASGATPDSANAGGIDLISPST